MLSPCRIPSNSHNRRQKSTNDVKIPQMTSNEPNPLVHAMTKNVAHVKLVKTKNILKGDGNIEIIDGKFDDIFYNIKQRERKKHSLGFSNLKNGTIKSNYL